MAFDLDQFAETSVPVKYEDLDFDTFDSQPLDAQTLRSLRYMCDVEFHTSCFLRDLLVTPSHREESAGGFMTMWNREEFWHGEALAAVLARHGIVVDYDELKAKRVKLGWQGAIEPLKQSALSNLVGTDFVAVHMVWGAANELSAVAAYRRLSALTDHPALSPLLQRIAQQETRHVAFYTTQGREKLEASTGAQRLVRLVLSKVWRPVGSGMMDESEVKHVMSHLFAGQSGELDKLDKRVQKLPGLEGLTIFRSAFARLGIA
ncbi:ferritin-like domain-containing protein [Brachybacterium sp. J144]|uniref:ferritin-like domain-containing protein n=1 Tax=Brachybacterium sp. J144 TaxID=3116487 RepID=UPI002E77EDBA|nr:ferritin-like domain-containing protein [Brachybacterium sp. J144]MEE1650094.1 ferritin-like domain-containing protein [Brachybacterium sp. J144]